MKWLIIGGLGVAILISMRSRSRADMPPEALPAPPLPPGSEMTAPMPVTVTTPEGETIEAIEFSGTYYVVR